MQGRTKNKLKKVISLSYFTVVLLRKLRVRATLCKMGSRVPLVGNNTCFEVRNKKFVFYEHRTGIDFTLVKG